MVLLFVVLFIVMLLLVLMLIVVFLFFLFGRIVVMILAGGVSLVLIFVFIHFDIFSVDGYLVYNDIFILNRSALLHIF